MKVWFQVHHGTGKLILPSENFSILGETADLSSTGIAFIVSSIRIKENYLVGEERILNAELDLPEGKIQMEIIGQRYEQVGQHISTARFLIGAKIVKMSDENRESYNHFLRYGNKRKKQSFALGIDES